MRGLATGDFTVTVAGQPRRVVSAEYVDTAAARVNTVSGEPASISTNDGAGLGRLFVFVVDQGTLEPGNVRHVARAASRFFENLSFVDRSALMLLPAGPNVNFTWAHDRVRDALGKVVGQSPNDTAWEFGSLSEARGHRQPQPAGAAQRRPARVRACDWRCRSAARPAVRRCPRVRARARRRPGDPGVVARREAAQAVAGRVDRQAAAAAGGGGGGGGGTTPRPVAAAAVGWGATAAPGISRCGRNGPGAGLR